MASGSAGMASRSVNASTSRGRVSGRLTQDAACICRSRRRSRERALRATFLAYRRAPGLRGLASSTSRACALVRWMSSASLWRYFS